MVKIFTLTVAISLHSSVDLVKLAKFTPINDKILGLKFKMGKGEFIITKGLFEKKGKGCFNNQVSMIVSTKEKPVNVKIFGNGKLHITGCKSKETAIEVKEILERELDKLESFIELEKDENGVLIEKSGNLIYGTNDVKRCIGIKCDTIYKINSDPCSFDKKKGVFISQKSSGKYTYPIYDLNGNKIGYKKLNLINSKKIFYKNRKMDVHYDEKTDTEFLIDNHIILGKYQYEYQHKPCTFVDVNCHSVWIEKNKNDEDFIPEIYSLMFSFDLGIKINREQLFKELIKDNQIVKYNPNKYSGVQWLINDPVCSVTIFQSGNVICFGIKNEDVIEYIHCLIKEKIFFLKVNVK